MCAVRGGGGGGGAGQGGGAGHALCVRTYMRIVHCAGTATQGLGGMGVAASSPGKGQVGSPGGEGMAEGRTAVCTAVHRPALPRPRRPVQYRAVYRVPHLTSSTLPLASMMIQCRCLSCTIWAPSLETVIL